MDGSKFLETEGTTAVSGLTIGGTVEWENTNTVTQSGGTVTIGDNIPADRRSSTTPRRRRTTSRRQRDRARRFDGVLYRERRPVEKTGGTGTSTIAPAVTNTGTIEVASGTLDFMRAVTGTGTDTISGASTLEFGAAVSSSTTVGDQKSASRAAARSISPIPRPFGAKSRVRDDQHGRAPGLVGVFQLLREFRRHAGDADA